MTVKYHNDLEQGSDAWRECRSGLITASEMKLLISHTLKLNATDKEKAHVLELAAQRVSGFVEDYYVTDDMTRGNADEIRAKAKYQEVYKTEITDVGFITNDKFGLTIGYSPDGLIGDDGCVECKSRRQKFQIDTIATYRVPDAHIIQVQTGLMVSERKWCDFVSYSGGWPMTTIRVYPDQKIQEAIFQAAYKFEKRIKEVIKNYEERIALMPNAFIPTERVIDTGEIQDE